MHECRTPDAPATRPQTHPKLVAQLSAREVKLDADWRPFRGTGPHATGLGLVVQELRPRNLPVSAGSSMNLAMAGQVAHRAVCLILHAMAHETPVPWPQLALSIMCCLKKIVRRKAALSSVQLLCC